MTESFPVIDGETKRRRKEGEVNLLYILWYNEKIDKAKQGSEDQGEDHSAGEVLIRDLVVLC